MVQTPQLPGSCDAISLISTYAFIKTTVDSFVNSKYQELKNLGLVPTKPVFGVSDKVRFKPVSSTTETS